MSSLTLVPGLRSALAAGLVVAAQSASAIAVLPPADLSTWTCTGICGSSAADGDIGLSPLGNARYGYVTTSDSNFLGVSPLTLSDTNEGIETNGSRIVSGAFNAAAGDTLDLRFNYISTDGKGFDDYAWARVVDATTGSLVSWLFTARSSNSSTGNIVPGDVVDKKDFDFKTTIVDYATFQFTSKTIDDPVNWSKLGQSNGTCWEDNAQGCGYTGWLQSRVSFASAGNYRVEIGVVNWGDDAFDSGLAFDYAGLTGGTAPVPEPTTLALLFAGLGLVGLRSRGRRAQ